MLVSEFEQSLAEKEKAMKEENRIKLNDLRSEFDLESDSIRRDSKDKLSVLSATLSREREETEARLRAEHEGRLEEMEKSSKDGKLELSLIHKTELSELSERLELEREEKEFQLREKISADLKQLKTELELQLNIAQSNFEVLLFLFDSIYFVVYLFISRRKRKF